MPRRPEPSYWATRLCSTAGLWKWCEQRLLLDDIEADLQNRFGYDLDSDVRPTDMRVAIGVVQAPTPTTTRYEISPFIHTTDLPARSRSATYRW